jgi:hypothetical protein
MRCLFAILLLWIGLPSFAGAARYEPESLDPNVKAKIAELPSGSDSRLSALRKWPKEMRLRYANGIRSFDPDLDYDLVHAGTERIGELLAMGDPIAASYMMEQARKLKSAEVFLVLRNWKDAEAVPFLAEFIETDEEFDERAPSFLATASLYHLLPELEEFPTSVRLWATRVGPEGLQLFAEVRSRHMKGITPLDVRDIQVSYREREILRHWWKANQAKITAHDYGGIVPGERFEAPSQFLPPIAALQAMRQPGPDRDVRVSLTASPGTSSAGSNSSQSHGDTAGAGTGAESGGTMWPYVIAGVAGIGASLVIWKVRFGSKRV